MDRNKGKHLNWNHVGGVATATLLTIALASCGGRNDNAVQPPSTSAATPATATSAAATTPDPTFKEATMTWGRVEEARAQLDAAVGADNFAGMRAPAVMMRDSLNALPGQSAALPSDKQEQLASHVTSVGQMVGMLDEATGSNNTDSIHEHHKAMDEALDHIRDLYPAGVMPAKTMMEDRMGEHGADKKMGMPSDGTAAPMKKH